MVAPVHAVRPEAFRGVDFISSRLSLPCAQWSIYSVLFPCPADASHSVISFPPPAELTLSSKNKKSPLIIIKSRLIDIRAPPTFIIHCCTGTLPYATPARRPPTSLCLPSCAPLHFFPCAQYTPHGKEKEAHAACTHGSESPSPSNRKEKKKLFTCICRPTSAGTSAAASCCNLLQIHAVPAAIVSSRFGFDSDDRPGAHMRADRSHLIVWLLLSRTASLLLSRSHRV
ncbi:hypothetical protein B0H17DRAFT_379871 [Mycena rosella]|uniref:Uncharacterized protein n=1 Tax=Mycena rosella TaxID=1033263 RepID=A0AAD7CPB6_MYCRO|nr:hypothetical protein B0H17DRAFT_379871 [Mycena rosella]